LSNRNNGVYQHTITITPTGLETITTVVIIPTICEVIVCIVTIYTWYLKLRGGCPKSIAIIIHNTNNIIRRHCIAVNSYGHREGIRTKGEYDRTGHINRRFVRNRAGNIGNGIARRATKPVRNGGRQFCIN